ncbi:MAG: anti-sigma regulatory factor, partial [Stackebrandtia sp.]
DGDVLLLDLPAAAAFLPVLRTATAGLATRLSFGLDAIEDLRLAVDEAAGLLMSAADKRDKLANLHCRFDVTQSDLVIAIGATGIGPLPSRQSFDWRVLDALAGSVGVDSHDGVTTVRLTQPRPRLSD